MTPLSIAKKTLAEEQVVELIRTRQGEKSLRQFAVEIGISPSYLSDIYLGTRKPGVKCLKYFGIAKTRRVVAEYTYRTGK